MDDLTGARPTGSSVASEADSASVGGLGDALAVAPASVAWSERVGTCLPRFDSFVAAGAEWATIRPFTLALLGDPVINLFAGQLRAPPRALAQELQKEDRGRWRQLSTSSNAVGFVAKFFARVGPVLDKEPELRKAVGALLVFVIEVDEVVDNDFHKAAKAASDAGQTETLAFCTRSLEVTTPKEYEKFAASHPRFKDVDLDGPYKTFEYFVFLSA